MTNSNPRDQLEQQVIERAGRDSQFRRELLSDPRGTVEREYGVSIPQDIQITVVEEASGSFYLVLPPEPAVVDEQLSDSELEAVAGGWDFTQGGPTCHTCLMTACPGGGLGGAVGCGP